MGFKENLNMSKIINKLVNYIEMAVSFVLIAAVLLMLVNCVKYLTDLGDTLQEFEFDYFLTLLLNLIIGLEFTRMLCKHTHQTILDVVLFAIARQLIVSHTDTIGTLLCSLSIFILYVTRKFFLPIEESKSSGISGLFDKIRNKRNGDSLQGEQLNNINEEESQIHNTENGSV